MANKKMTAARSRARPQITADGPVKTAWLHVRLDPRKHECYKDAAEKDGRTLSNWVEHNLDSALGR